MVNPAGGQPADTTATRAIVERAARLNDDSDGDDQRAYRLVADLLAGVDPASAAPDLALGGRRRDLRP